MIETEGNVFFYIFRPTLERWPSGLRRAPGKRVSYVKWDRGFESLFLRKVFFIKSKHENKY